MISDNRFFPGYDFESLPHGPMPSLLALIECSDDDDDQELLGPDCVTAEGAD